MREESSHAPLCINAKEIRTKGTKETASVQHFEKIENLLRRASHLCLKDFVVNIGRDRLATIVFVPRNS